jgi:hypothetical protein
VNLIQEFLQQHGSELISQLVQRVGFDPAQAARFLPAAGQQVMGLLGGGELDLGSLLGGGDISSLLTRFDTEGLAQESGVSVEKAREGLESIGPQLLSGLSDQAGGADALMGALGGDSGGGLLGAAGKLAGGFFNKD